MSRNITFPTMWYVRPATTQTSLCICTFTKLKIGLHRFVWAKLVKMSLCCKSRVAVHITICILDTPKRISSPAGTKLECHRKRHFISDCIFFKIETIFRDWVTSYSITCVKNGHSQKDKTKISMTNGSLMRSKVLQNAPPWSILQYFWPA